MVVIMLTVLVQMALTLIMVMWQVALVVTLVTAVDMNQVK
jgi:hypothetical protein